MPSPRKQSAPKIRYGIAEIYGRDFAGLKADEIRHRTQQPANTVPCPSRLDGKLCPKKGGVCSWRLYREEAAGALPVEGAPLVTICPQRFEESRTFLSVIDPPVAVEAASRHCVGWVDEEHGAGFSLILREQFKSVGAPRT